jgi:hypothetical protein
VITPTERAVEVVLQAQTAARRFDPDAHIRLVRDGSGVRFAFADGPLPGDTRIPCGEAHLWAEAGLEGTLDVGEHNTPALSPSRS